HVGPTTRERGFEKAKIIVNGEEKEGYGGGVCQISSTLYNAAKNAGLEIIERHPHSKEVAYIEKGKDAATSYGGVDLKFKNTLPYSVKIDSYIAGNAVYVQIVRI
ncbi:MAG: VanW family protein, partial [Defluviitaleaceae bacterium]|nr:VanW family protein [Defluviitaleaceae bacterium]